MMPTVLIVDDNPDIRSLLVLAMEKAGLKPVVAQSATAAFALLADGELPAVILLDVQMPDVDGWSTLTAIRSNPRTSDVAVVLCTVKGGPEDAQHGWRLGCDGYVSKPFHVDQLVDEIRAVISRTTDERERVRQAALDDARRPELEATGVGAR